MHFTNFLDDLNEAKEQLDISIQAADKYFTTVKKIEEFLTANVEIEHKTDGVKLTVIKKDNNGNINDYIFAYKGNILYTTEFNYQSISKIKRDSIGASQFQMVFEHFSTLKENSIPVGTELFIEFLMKKPTLSSKYTVNHKMVLIGYSKSTWNESFGKLKTTPIGFNIEMRSKYAKELKIDEPLLLFKGTLASPMQFEKGINHPALQSEYNKVKTSIKWDNLELLYADLKHLFLAVESKYGGKEEGVVLKFNDKLLKWQQIYQLDQVARAGNKAEFKEDNPLDETKYWESVKFAALKIVNSIEVKSRKLEDVLEELAGIMKRYPIDFKHSKKTEAMIKDDVQLTAKTQLIKKMRGNNNALIIGKFRILTKDGHYKLIKRAQTLYDNVVICLVTSGDTKETKELREKMIRAVFPKVEIIYSTNGNLVNVIQKSPMNINIVYAGSDRVKSYQEQLKYTLGTEVREMERSDSDISATKVIENLWNKPYFEKNTPKEIHSMYEEIKKAYE